MAFCNDWWVRCRKMSTSDSWRPCCVKCPSLHYTVFGSDWVSRTRHHFCIRLSLRCSLAVRWTRDSFCCIQCYNILQNGEKRQKSNRAIQGICAISYFCFHPLQSICCIKSILVKIQIKVEFLRNLFDTFNYTDFTSQINIFVDTNKCFGKGKAFNKRNQEISVKNSFRLNCVGL